MSSPNESALVYDWNIRKRHHKLTERPVALYDETLRDGIQGPSIIDPPIEAKRRILELSARLGIEHVNLGLPGAGPRAVRDVTALAKHLLEKRLTIKPSCAARTHLDDVKPIVEISQQLGLRIEVMAFLGASPIRRYVEAWSLSRMLELSTKALRFAVAEGLPATFVTEDTTRSRPADLDALFKNAIDCGARRLCLCDTVGHATPDGVRNLLDFAKDVIETTGAEVGLDWHGHNDRGLALTNSLSAMEHGADRIHGTALGIGERVGNASLDLLLVNLHLLHERDGDLSALPEWCRTVSEAVGHPIERSYPVLGSDAFRTATGVHAAAVIKAEKKGEAALADEVYSGVPASLVGRTQQIDVGPMSGLSNVTRWLDAHGHPDDAGLAVRLLAAAKESDRVLTDEELEALVQSTTAAPLGRPPPPAPPPAGEG